MNIQIGKLESAFLSVLKSLAKVDLYYQSEEEEHKMILLDVWSVYIKEQRKEYL